MTTPVTTPVLMPPFEPGSYFARDILRDGEEAYVRAVHQGDQRVLSEVIRSLSPDSRYFRYLSTKHEPTNSDLSNFIETSVPRHVALVGFTLQDREEKWLGVGEFFDSECSDSAELAFAVKEAHQGRGVASMLLRHLAEIGRLAGLRSFEAFVHPHNTRMLSVFRKCGLPAHFFDDQILVRVILDL
ncbi:MAG: GNAT family N-acetyltransferase [Candidatus Obscuribacterales bacterium]|nr:GNAT family N-acetyltransferase [Candidatus Obscuribacterales bacterium]